MTEEEDRALAGAELDAVLLNVYLSGFKSGIGTMILNQLPDDIPEPLRKTIVEKAAQGLTDLSFDDPASREVARDCIRETVRDQGDDGHSHDGATILRVHHRG